MRPPVQLQDGDPDFSDLMPLKTALCRVFGGRPEDATVEIVDQLPPYPPTRTATAAADDGDEPATRSWLLTAGPFRDRRGVLADTVGPGHFVVQWHPANFIVVDERDLRFATRRRHWRALYLALTGNPADF